MTPILPNHLEELKTCVLLAAGIANPMPADCKFISILINKKTRQYVSETTLKRIYGFAYSKFKPSLFTINTMAQFCDYVDWKDFYQRKIAETKTSNSKNNLGWLQLRQKAATITGYTLQTLKNKSGIPYSKTIKRDFIDYHLQEFITSGCAGTVITAPAGYGKTIAICHWIDEKMMQDEANDGNDIILMFSGNALMSTVHSGGSVSHWLLSLLGYNNTENNITTLLDVEQRKNGKFYLIVDGLDEFMFRSEQFRIILNQLVDVFSFYQSHQWFKLILTTRTSTWVNNKHQLAFNPDTWYTGINSGDNFINVPLFSLREINDLCKKINPDVTGCVDIDIAQLFNHPLYLQEYYKIHKADFSLSSADHTSLYELIAAYVLNKVYLGPHSSEKIALINALVEYVDLGGSEQNIRKLKVDHLIKQYPHAYNDLTSVGFLREFNESSNFHYNSYLTFGNENYLEYSIAQSLLFKNDDRFDKKLITTINELFNGSTRKVNVLKWCIILSAQTDGLDTLEYVTEAVLNPNEKTNLIVFIGELLERDYNSGNQGGILMKYFKQPLSNRIFEYFFGLELINPSYKKTLNMLLKFELSGRRRIIILSALGIIALIELNLDEVHRIINKLSQFPPDELSCLPVNPLLCLDSYYHCLKYNFIKKDALRELTQLYFSHPDNDANLHQTASNDLLYLLGVHTLFLCANPKKVLRFINFLNKHYRSEAPSNCATQYAYFIQVNKAAALFEIGDQKSVNDIYNSFTSHYADKQEMFTPFMKILYHNLRIKVLLNTQNQLLVINEIKNIVGIAKKWGYKYSKLKSFATILNDEEFKNESPEFYRQIAYDATRMCREHDLDLQLFTRKKEEHRVS